MFRRAAIWAVVGAVIIGAAGVALSLRDGREADVSTPPPPWLPTRVQARATTMMSTTQLSPSPKLKPEEVVRIVVEALANNDDEDEGIRITWEFASPGNKQFAGPIERFAPMVKSPAYQPMLNSTSAEYHPVVVIGNRAEEMVGLSGPRGGMAYYIFRLSRQTEGPLKDCWMTDGVVRVHAGGGTGRREGARPQPAPKSRDDSAPI